jgi:hypothetical protein
LAAIGKFHPLALHAVRDLDSEIEIFRKNVPLCDKAGLVVYVEESGQDQEKRILSADEPSRIEKLLFPFSRSAESGLERNVHVQHVKQVVDLERVGGATRTDLYRRLQCRPIVGEAEPDYPVLQLAFIRPRLPIPVLVQFDLLRGFFPNQNTYHN